MITNNKKYKTIPIISKTMIFFNLLSEAISLRSRRCSKIHKITPAKIWDFPITAIGIAFSKVKAHATAGMQSADNKMVSFFICVSYFMKY